MKKNFGIIGNPIRHSLSPVLHNYWFKKYGLDAEYSILETSDKEIGNVVQKIKNKDLNGINVTLAIQTKNYSLPRYFNQ